MLLNSLPSSSKLSPHMQSGESLHGTISHSLVANKEKHPARLLVMHPTEYIRQTSWPENKAMMLPKCFCHCPHTHRDLFLAHMHPHMQEELTHMIMYIQVFVCLSIIIAKINSFRGYYAAE